jgi:hypothetical protein
MNKFKKIETLLKDWLGDQWEDGELDALIYDIMEICEEENNSMQKVILEFYGTQDYLFEIEDIKHLEDAIEYKNNAREDCEEKYEDYSDFEIIVDYLHEHNIEFNYMALFNVEHLEY